MKRCVFLALLLTAALVLVTAFVLVGCTSLTATGAAGTTLSLTTTSSPSTLVSVETSGSATTLSGPTGTTHSGGSPTTVHSGGSPAATATTAAPVAVTTTSLELKAALYQQTDPHLSWDGSWMTANGPLSSGGSERLSDNAGASVTFTFNGTRITWLGYMGENAGIATVYLDGHSQTVDLYRAGTHYQSKIWSSGALAYGDHKVSIECTGTADPGSLSTAIWVDAFDITGTLE